MSELEDRVAALRRLDADIAELRERAAAMAERSKAGWAKVRVWEAAWRAAAGEARAKTETFIFRGVMAVFAIALAVVAVSAWGKHQ